MTRREIIATFERRLDNPPDFELAECLRNIHRIAEIRLDDKFGHEPTLGNQVWDWAEQLATHSDPGYAERGELTVTYLTDAHRACASASCALDAPTAASTRSRSTRSATWSASTTAATRRPSAC